jgi:hypothetical protein
MRAVAGFRNTSSAVTLSIVVVALCASLGALVTGAIRLPPPLDLPSGVIVGALAFSAVTPLLLPRWRVTFWFLLSWLIVEDLVRKFLGNDLRVYFFKDVIFVLLLVGMIADPAVRGMWRRATGSARLPLYAVIAWSLVMAVPLALVDWRIPLVGLKLDFSFLPLLVPGYMIAREPGGVRRLLIGIVAVGIPACLIGIVQGTIGPEFLRPSLPTPDLRLELVRNGDVFQPTGTFADAGRFGSMAQVMLTSSLALLVMGWRTDRSLLRLFAASAVVISASAVWVHAGKTGLVVSAALIVVAVIGAGAAERRSSLTRVGATAGVVVFAVVGVFFFLPELSADRVDYFRDTLDPRSSSNQWSLRFAGWEDNTLRGLQGGGLLGSGTGAGSLGLQYLGDESAHDLTGVAQVEGGYAVVLLEWGIVGLVLWLAWTVMWAIRQWTSVKYAGGHPEAVAGIVVVAYMMFFLFISFVQGFQAFQNYYANAYFWLLSGLVFAIPESVRRKRASAAASG